LVILNTLSATLAWIGRARTAPIANKKSLLISKPPIEIDPSLLRSLAATVGLHGCLFVTSSPLEMAIHRLASEAVARPTVPSLTG
jgi:hypothetical protein